MTTILTELTPEQARFLIDSGQFPELADCLESQLRSLKQQELADNNHVYPLEKHTQDILDVVREDMIRLGNHPYFSRKGHISLPTYPPGAVWEPIPQSDYQDDEYHIFWGVEEPDRAASWRHGRLPRTQEEIVADLPAGKTYICMRRKPEEAQDDL